MNKRHTLQPIYKTESVKHFKNRLIGPSDLCLGEQSSTQFKDVFCNQSN